MAYDGLDVEFVIDVTDSKLYQAMPSPHHMDTDRQKPSTGTHQKA